MEQLVDSSSGGLQDFHLGQGSTASSSGPADEAFFRVFSHFSLEKSAKVNRHSSARVPRHVSTSTLSAHQMAPGSSAVLGNQDKRTELIDDNGHVLVRLDTVHGSYWKNLDSQLSQWHPPWWES